MKKYVFKPYSPAFPELFDRERARIAMHLNNALSIEHVGSTAVPGLGGKGIIDIAIGTSGHNMDALRSKLLELGYDFRPSFSTPERLFFRQDLPDLEEGKRRYHIHLMPLGSREWQDMIAFRDHLRTHPEAKEAYATLKKTAAEEANGDGEIYRKIKEPLFVEVLSKARNKPLP